MMAAGPLHARCGEPQSLPARSDNDGCRTGLDPRTDDRGEQAGSPKPRTFDGPSHLFPEDRSQTGLARASDIESVPKALCCGPSPWSLVPKPIPVLRPGQPTEHQLNHADPDLRLAGISQVFIILAVNPALTQPAEGSLHHPPPRQQLKPSVPGKPADDLNHIPPVLRDPAVQGVIVVLGVRPQLPQARERFSRQLAEDLRCRRRIIHGRTGDGHGCKYSVNPPASVQRVPCPRPRPRLAVGSVLGIPRRNLTMRRGYDVSGAGTSSSHPHARLCSGLRFHGRNRSTSSTARPPAWAHASR